MVHSLVPFKKYAVGYEINGMTNFISMIEPYLPTIKEVFFSWPGMISGRSMPYRGDTGKACEQLLSDLSWCRSHGVCLDLLFNGNCYGEDAFSAKLRNRCYDVMECMRDHGLLPEIVTTTSQYIAKIIKMRYPETDVRASVNMCLQSTRSFSFISDLFDSFYLRRDLQRDLKTLKIFSDYCHSHGKKLAILANSGCLRFCPVQTYHDNFISHNSTATAVEALSIGFSMRLCSRHFSKQKNKIDYLRMSWIRPEDISFYEPYVDAIKIATRATMSPATMVKAYAEGHYEGNLLKLLGCGATQDYIDNTAFPKDWVQSGIAQNCASNCTECGRCDEVFRKVYSTKRYSYSFAPPPGK